MAYPVYSTRFVSVNAYSGGEVVVYTVPAGFRAVYRTLSITFGANAGAGGGYFRLHSPGPVVASYYQQLAVDLFTDTTNGHFVQDPGEELRIGTLGGWTGDFHASGYLLTLP